MNPLLDEIETVGFTQSLDGTRSTTRSRLVYSYTDSGDTLADLDQVHPADWERYQVPGTDRLWLGLLKEVEELSVDPVFDFNGSRVIDDTNLRCRTTWMGMGFQNRSRMVQLDRDWSRPSTGSG